MTCEAERASSSCVYMWEAQNSIFFFDFQISSDLLHEHESSTNGVEIKHHSCKSDEKGNSLTKVFQMFTEHSKEKRWQTLSMRNGKLTKQICATELCCLNWANHIKQKSLSEKSKIKN